MTSDETANDGAQLMCSSCYFDDLAALCAHHVFGTFAKQVGISPPSRGEDTKSLKEEVTCPIIPSVAPMVGLTS